MPGLADAIVQGFALHKDVEEAPLRVQQAKLQAQLYEGQAKHQEAQAKLIELDMQQRMQAQQEVQQKRAQRQMGLQDALTQAPQSSPTATYGPAEYEQAPEFVGPQRALGPVLSQPGTTNPQPQTLPAPAPQPTSTDSLHPDDQIYGDLISAYGAAGQIDLAHKASETLASINKVRREARQQQALENASGMFTQLVGFTRAAEATGQKLDPGIEATYREKIYGYLMEAGKPEQAQQFLAGKTLITQAGGAINTVSATGAVSGTPAYQNPARPVVVGENTIAVQPSTTPNQPATTVARGPERRYLAPPNTTMLDPQGNALTTTGPSKLQESQMDKNAQQIASMKARDAMIPQQMDLNKERIAAERERIAELQARRAAEPAKAKEIDQRIEESKQRIKESQERVKKLALMTPLEADEKGVTIAGKQLRNDLYPAQKQLLEQNVELAATRVQELQEQIKLYPERTAQIQQQIELSKSQVQLNMGRLDDLETMQPYKIEESQARTADTSSRTEARAKAQTDKDEFASFMADPANASAAYQDITARLAKVNPTAATREVLRMQRAEQPSNILETMAASLGIPLNKPWTPEQAAMVTQGVTEMQGKVSGQRGANVPVPIEVQQELQGLQTLKRNFVALSTEFTPAEMRQYVGFFNRPLQAVEAILKDTGLMQGVAKGDAKYNRFLTLVGEVFAIGGFAIGGKAFTGPERDLLMEFMVTGKEKTYERFRANLEHGLARIDPIIQQRVILATTPREDLAARMGVQVPALPAKDFRLGGTAIPQGAQQPAQARPAARPVGEMSTEELLREFGTGGKP